MKRACKMYETNTDEQKASSIRPLKINFVRMKTILLSTLLVFMTFITLKAEERDFRFGLVTSTNLGWFKPDVNNLQSAGVRLGFSYGLMGDFRLSDNYAITTGLSDLRIGGKLEYPDFYLPAQANQSASGRTEASIGFRYIEVPIALKMKTNEIGYITYYGQFGISTGVNINSKASFKTEPRDVGDKLSTEDVDVSKQIPILRMGLVVGAGIEYSLSGNTKLLVGVSYNNGFFNNFRRRNIGGYNPGLGTKEFTSYEADNGGFAVVEDDGSLREANNFKAYSNFFSLHVGIFF
jgi:hypothetical protein